LLSTIRLRILDDVIHASASIFDADGEGDVRSKVEAIVDQTIRVTGFAGTRDERMRLVDDVVAEATGFGPLEPLLHDGTVTEVMVNGGPPTRRSVGGVWVSAT
jgi:pilus assembly protein CpaF